MLYGVVRETKLTARQTSIGGTATFSLPLGFCAETSFPRSSPPGHITIQRNQSIQRCRTRRTFVTATVHGLSILAIDQTRTAATAGVSETAMISSDRSTVHHDDRRNRNQAIDESHQQARVLPATSQKGRLLSSMSLANRKGVLSSAAQLRLR